ncbi:MAG: DUF6911 family protein [Usitatibacteraceae bacterium]
MNDLLLTWSDAGKGGHIKNPEWSDVDAKLSANLGGKGVIGIEGETEGGLGRSIQVRFEDGKYLLTFGYETEDDWIVRMYQNGESRSDEITLLGDVWRSNCICRDPAIVRQAFNQFFYTGTVSDVLMNA